MWKWIVLKLSFKQLTVKRWQEMKEGEIQSIKQFFLSKPVTSPHSISFAMYWHSSFAELHPLTTDGPPDFQHVSLTCWTWDLKRFRDLMWLIKQWNVGFYSCYRTVERPSKERNQCCIMLVRSLEEKKVCFFLRFLWLSFKGPMCIIYRDLLSLKASAL